MNNKWLILINPIIAVLIMVQAFTGLNSVFTFLDRKTFVTLHAYSGYLLFTLILCHVVINWFWIRNVFLREKKGKKPGKTHPPEAEPR